jgi:hypothetical protein
MLPIVLLASASLFLALALLAFWQSVRALFGRGVDDISAAIGGDRAALIDEKNSLLTALKDIEFERAVGKVSDADWKRLDAAYRARAKEVLAELDRDLGPWREKAEKLVQERLGQRKPAKSAPAAAKGAASAKGAKPSKAAKAKKPDDAVAEPVEAAPEPAEAAPEPAEAERAAPDVEEVAEPPEAAASADESPAEKPTCPSCSTVNEVDAVFCKKCAARLAESGAEEAS